MHIHNDNLPTGPVDKADSGPPTTGQDRPIVRSTAPAPGPDRLSGHAVVSAFASVDPRVAYKLIRRIGSGAAAALPLVQGQVFRESLGNAVAAKLRPSPPTVRTRNSTGGSWRLKGLVGSLHRGWDAVMGGHDTPVAPADYPSVPAECIIDHLSPADAHVLSQVDKRHRHLTAHPATAHLLERRAQRLLATAKRQQDIHSNTNGRPWAFDLSGQVVAAPIVLGGVGRNSHVSDIAELIGSPSGDDGRGGSGILGLPRKLQDAPLAVLQELARTTHDANLVKAIEALRAGKEGGFASVVGALAGQVCSLADVRSVLGQPPDARGFGGCGILALPAEQQVEPLRAAIERVGTALFSDWPAAFALLTELTVRLGDAVALENLAVHYVVPAGPEGEAARRLMWTAACTPARGENAMALFHVQQQLRHFPTGERVERFQECLAAWKLLVEQDPERFCEPPSQPALAPLLVPRQQAWPVADIFQEQARDFLEMVMLEAALQDPALLRNAAAARLGSPLRRIDAVLRDLLHEAVPASFHEEGERRIAALRQAIDAARPAAAG